MHLLLWACLVLGAVNATTPSSKSEHSLEKTGIEPTRITDDVITSVIKLKDLQEPTAYKKGHTSPAKINIGPSKVVRQSQTSRLSRSPEYLDHHDPRPHHHHHSREYESPGDLDHHDHRPHHHHHSLEDSREYESPGDLDHHDPRPHHHHHSLEDSREYEDSPEDSNEHVYPHHEVRHPQVDRTPQLQHPGSGYPSHQRVSPPPLGGYGAFPTYHKHVEPPLYDEVYDRTDRNH